jgi:hypothetical protein
VTWTKLLANRDVQSHRTSKRELDDIRALIARDLADAGVTAVSADRRFATAYNAALLTAHMVIACAGYRVTAKTGHHKVSFDAITLALGAGAGRELDVAVVLRQVVLLGPEMNLFRCSTRASIAVGLASIPPLEEPLIVALELGLEHHSLHCGA